ncbi:hypothetical protein [Shivajiella indica]|uniref:Tryptophan-rich sensory protein n=1 Tax=Shivajiella indica TaxID=872115 RepID=A0ABW5B7G1_9BACT
MKNFLLLIFNTLTFFGTLFLNYLYGSGAGGRKSVGEISNQYNTLITPSGYAFSIWGLIYLLLIGFILFQWISFFKKEFEKSINPTGIWLGLSNLLNALWIIVWTKEHLTVSVIVIFALLASLVKLIFSLRIGERNIKPYAFIGLPIGIYTGWIIVASVVNLSVWIFSKGWLQAHDVFWTNLVLLVATGIYILIQLKRDLFSPTFVGVWAFIAIAVKQWNAEPFVSYFSLAMVLVLLLSVFFNIKNKKWHLN